MDSFGKILVGALWLSSQCLGFGHSDLPSVTDKVASASLASEKHQLGNRGYDGARGNLHAIYDREHAGLVWYESRPTGYGSIPGYRPPPLGHGADVAASSAWRGCWLDITGLCWRGHRYYHPVAGRFLSADPAGQAGSQDLYSAFNGDPVNYWDPDGRYSKSAVAWGTGIELGGAVPFSEQLLEYRRGGQPVVGPQIDFGVNLAISTFTPQPDGYSPEEQQRLRQLAVNEFGSPMQRLTGYQQDAQDLNLATDLGPAFQSAMMAYAPKPGAQPVPTGADLALENVLAEATWRVGPHGEMPTPRPPGTESHHGVNSVWMEENVAGYKADNAPAILMENEPFHNATRGVFNRFRSELAARQGVSPRNVDWSKVSPGTAWRLAEEQLQAAQVLAATRSEYFRQFNQYLDSLP